MSLRDICPGSKTLLSSAGNLSERDIENKFSSLSLAFKTDRVSLQESICEVYVKVYVSLQERHELQLRQRDIAERNVATEIRQLGASIRFFSLVFLHMIEQSAVNQELGQGVSGRRDEGGVGQGGKAGGHHVLHCISVFIN